MGQQIRQQQAQQTAGPAAAVTAAALPHSKAEATLHRSATAASSAFAAAPGAPNRVLYSPSRAVDFPLVSLVRARLAACYGPAEQARHSRLVKAVLGLPETGAKDSKVGGSRRMFEEAEGHWAMLRALWRLLAALAQAGPQGASLLRAALLGQEERADAAGSSAGSSSVGGAPLRLPVAPGFESSNLWELLKLHAHIAPVRASWCSTVGHILAALVTHCPPALSIGSKKDHGGSARAAGRKQPGKGHAAVVATTSTTGSSAVAVDDEEHRLSLVFQEACDLLHGQLAWPLEPPPPLLAGERLPPVFSVASAACVVLGGVLQRLRLCPHSDYAAHLLARFLRPDADTIVTSTSQTSDSPLLCWGSCMR